jgi:hypothetical protein
VHPEMLTQQASFYPLVTCYITEKTINSSDFAKDQLSAQRRSTVSIEVVGAVFNQNFISVDEDPADEDINYLMENVELVLRSDPSLNNLVKWQRPSSVRYYITALDEQTHLRAGILQIEAETFY